MLSIILSKFYPTIHQTTIPFNLNQTASLGYCLFVTLRTYKTVMRLHRNLTFAVIDSIRDIFNEGVYAGKAVEKALKRDKRWGARDRKFVAETIYEIVRWNRLYAAIAEVKTPYDRDNLWRLFSVWCVLKGIPLPEWKTK